MAKLIYASSMSLDGCTEDERGAFDWAPPNDDVFAFITDLMRSASTTNSLLVEFTLSPEGEHTRLRVSESALGSIDRPDIDKAQYTEEHSHGWGDFLDRLARLHADRV